MKKMEYPGFMLGLASQLAHVAGTEEKKIHRKTPQALNDG
jgi:hypothetical protein